METTTIEAAKAACQEIIDGIIDSRFDMSIDWNAKFVNKLKMKASDTFLMDKDHLKVFIPLYQEFKKNCERVLPLIAKTKEYCGNLVNAEDIAYWDIDYKGDVYGYGIDYNRDDEWVQFPATLLTMTDDEIKEMVDDILKRERMEEEIEKKAKEHEEREKAEAEYKYLKEKYGFE